MIGSLIPLILCVTWNAMAVGLSTLVVSAGGSLDPVSILIDKGGFGISMLVRTTPADRTDGGFRVREMRAHAAVWRRPPTPSDTTAARTQGYTHTASVWTLCLVQGPFIL